MKPADYQVSTTKAVAESFHSCSISFLKEKKCLTKVFYLNMPTEQYAL